MKIISAVMILLCILIFFPLNISPNAAPVEEAKMTGADFVSLLIEYLHLNNKLPENAAINNKLDLLKSEGLIFPENFSLDKPITNEQKADLLSQILSAKIELSETARIEAYRDKAIIKRIKGDVTIKRKETENWTPAELDMILTEGDYIKTGTNSIAFLLVGVAGKIEVRENSVLHLKDLSTQPNKRSENILIYLAMGEISVDARHIDKDTNFETHTPTTLSSVIGTIYTVSVSPIDGKTEVREEE